jgi:hypothetical protein
MAGTTKAPKASETQTEIDQTTGKDATPSATPLAPVVEALPTSIDARTAGDLRSRLSVIDVNTGKVIDKVIKADTEAGTVTRFAVEDGNLVRKNDRFVTITEDRPIRFEWSEEAAAE